MIDWSVLSVNPCAELKHILAILNEQVEAKIVLVVDDETKRLLGTITDGDIRRALLAGKTMDCVAKDVMQADFVSAVVNEFNDFELQMRMQEKSIMQMPIVDENGIVCGLKLLNYHQAMTRLSTPVVIMAGGLGTRLRPLTDNCPKPMLKVDGKPMLEIILESLIQQGFQNFYIALNYLGEQIEAYFLDGSHFGVNINYLYENKRLGTAGALSLLPETIDESLIVLNGDVLTKVDYVGLLSFHSESNSDMSICVREHQTEVPFGVINLEGNQVRGITEKPSYNDFVNAGIYAIKPSVLQQLLYSEYKDMPEVVKDLLDEGGVVSAFPLYEYWMDIGRHSEFQVASKEYEAHFKL